MITILAIISTNTTITNITNGIQIGANTHNQDQVITPVSFNAINKIANSPENPIPELVVDLLSDISLNLKVCRVSQIRTDMMSMSQTWRLTISPLP